MPVSALGPVPDTNRWKVFRPFLKHCERRAERLVEARDGFQHASVWKCHEDQPDSITRVASFCYPLVLIHTIYFFFFAALTFAHLAL